MNRVLFGLEKFGRNFLSFLDKLYSRIINKKRPKEKKQNTDPDKFVVSVRLADIKKFVPNKKLKPVFKLNRVHFSNIPSFIWDGSWDKEALSIEENYDLYSKSFKSVFQMLEDEIHFTETVEYIDKLKTIQQHGSTARGDTVEELDKYFEDLLNLAKSIANDGYKKQEDLGGEWYDEIGVFLGRNGEIIKAEDKFCGTHRFAIAKFLKLVSVPVCVLAVHKEWEAKNGDILKDKNKLESYLNKKST